MLAVYLVRWGFCRLSAAFFLYCACMVLIITNISQGVSSGHLQAVLCCNVVCYDAASGTAC